jgi:HEAT repeat protein
MEIVLYVLVGLAVLALCAIALRAGVRPHGAAPAEPAVPPDAFEAPASPGMEEEDIGQLQDVREVESSLEEQSVEAPEEGDLVPRPPPPDVDTLIQRMRSGSPSVCREAIDGLCAHGEAAIPALERALSDPDPDVRIDAQKAIDRIRAGG